MKLQDQIKTHLASFKLIADDEINSLAEIVTNIIEKSINENSQFINSHNSVDDITKMIIDSYVMNLAGVVDEYPTVTRTETVYNNRYDYEGHTVETTKGLEIYNTLCWSVPTEFVERLVKDVLRLEMSK